MRSMLLLATLITGLHSAGHSAALAEEPLAIGSRLELFVDDFLIDQLAPTLQQILHRPEPGWCLHLSQRQQQRGDGIHRGRVRALRY